MFFKSKITRVTAFFLSCLMIGIAAFGSVDAIIRYMNFTENDKRHEYYSAFDQPYVLYDKLWYVGVMYLRNLDENGIFTGSEELEQQTIDYLTELGCMDRNGRLNIDVPENYRFYVSWGVNSYSNDPSMNNYSADDLDPKTDQFLSLRRDNLTDTVGFPHFYGRSDISDRNYHVTNYGMTYYYKNHTGTAFFDFDTTGLGSYVDELGATIYYKLDGSTPLPDSCYVPEEIDMTAALYPPERDVYEEIFDEPESDFEPDIEPVTEPATAEGTYKTDVTQETSAAETEKTTVTTAKPVTTVPVTAPADTSGYEGGYYYYSPDMDAFIPAFSEKQFTNVLGSTKELTIIIQPDTKLLAGYRTEIDGFNEQAQSILLGIVNYIPFGIAALVLALYVLIMGGYSTAEKKFVMGSGDRVFAEIPIAVGIAIIILGVALAFEAVIDGVKDAMEVLYTEKMTCWLYGAAYAALFGGFMLMVNTIIVRLKCSSFWKTTLVGRIAGAAARCVKNIRSRILDSAIDRERLRDDTITRRFMIRTLVLFAVEAVMLMILAASHAIILYIVVMIILAACYIILCLRDFLDLTKLYRHISDINNGNYTKQIVERDSAVYVPTEKLNNISDGIRSAVEEQVKSERMKIELVTNVSHDLKTPLTSIISYIDLLKTEDMPPAARDYVSIIDAKSQRLKTMVADLFDLAKATSKVDINAEVLDAVILTEQVLADLADKIEASGREIRKDIRAEQAPICADGKKMYRVFQNLIDNALKYSMAGTRIYVILKSEHGSCTITVKNIAAYEMDFSAEEIMERFTRGDRSRSTEGNGLGLSIAKSFTEACGGSFGVTVDGDVFIAELTLPIVNKPEQ